MEKIIIGARASNLAQIQANIIKDMLLSINNNIEIDIIPISTKGDQQLDINWKTSTESLKGLFTSELEESLLDCTIDIAVHSLKDMPTEYHSDLCIAGYINQDDERDAFVSNDFNSINDLPLNAVVGTSSIRRELQLLNIRPDLRIKVIRGNIETRLAKLDAKEYDAIILAAAGLNRSNKNNRIKQIFNDDEMISSPGQGILCLQTRKNDTHILKMIDKIKDGNTTLKAHVERTFSTIFDGGCTTPMGCNATITKDNRILFKGMYYYEGKRYDGYVEGYTYEKEAIAYRLSNQIKNQYTRKKGKVFLVGAGPGDYDLLTIKAQKLIKEADCILYDRLVSNDILNSINSTCKLIYVGKDNHESGLSQSLINEQLVDAAFEFKKIIRLKSGDPFIFGRGYEEIQMLNSYNIEYEIVPGISSFIGASAYSGIPLTDRNHSSSIHIFSGHGKNNTDILDYETIAKLDGTLVFFMSIRNVKDIVSNLMHHGKSINTNIVFIENATTSDQRIITSTFNEVLTTDIILKVKAPAIIIIGDVVSLSTKARWFNQEKNITLLSTRESKHFKSFFQQARDYRFDSLSAPQIEIKEISNQKLDLSKYDIILFNSANGVNNFINQYTNFSLSNKLIGAIGIMTTKILKDNSIKIDIAPKVSNIDELLEHVSMQYKNKSILVVGSDKMKNNLNMWQRRSNNNVELCIVYTVDYINSNYLDLVEQINNSNVVCFFSTSGVNAFFKNINYQYELLDAKKIASIGPHTTESLKKHGIKTDIEAKISTQEGLINEIKEFYNV